MRKYFRFEPLVFVATCLACLLALYVPLHLLIYGAVQENNPVVIILSFMAAFFALLAFLSDIEL